MLLKIDFHNHSFKKNKFNDCWLILITYEFRKKLIRLRNLFKRIVDSCKIIQIVLELLRVEEKSTKFI